MFLLNFFTRSKSKTRQIGKDNNLDSVTNSIIPELQTEHIDGIDDATAIIRNSKQISRIDIRVPTHEARHELTEGSTPVQQLMNGTPNNQSAKDRSGFINQTFSSHDNSVILKDSINRSINRRGKTSTTVSADRAQERPPSKHIDNSKFIRPKIPRAETHHHERPDVPPPHTYLRPLKVQQKKQDHSKERERPEVRAEQMFRRSENFVKKQQQSIARALREIGSYEKNPTEPKASGDTSYYFNKKRETSGTPLRDKKDTSMIVEDRYGTPARDFFRETESGRNSYKEPPRRPDGHPSQSIKKPSIEYITCSPLFT